MQYEIILPSLKPLGGNRVLIDFGRWLKQQSTSCKIGVMSKVGSMTFGADPTQLHFIGGGTGLAGRFMDLVRTVRYMNAAPPETVFIVSEPLLAIACYFVGRSNFIRFHQADDQVLFDNNPRIKSRLALRIYKQLNKLSYRNKRVFNLFVSGYVRDAFLKEGGIRAGAVVNPGINPEMFNTDVPVARKPLTVGIYARDLRWKGFADFCAALNRLKAADIELEPILITQDQLDIDLAMPYEIVRPKSDREICATLQRIDVFVHPSWVEGYGLPPLEAMACGCVTVLSDSGGPRDYGRDEENCLFFPPGDSSQLADRLQRLVADPLLKEQLRRQAMETAARFTTAAFCKRFFCEVSSEGNHPR